MGQFEKRNEEPLVFLMLSDVEIFDKGQALIGNAIVHIVTSLKEDMQSAIPYFAKHVTMGYRESDGALIIVFSDPSHDALFEIQLRADMWQFRTKYSCPSSCDGGCSQGEV